MKVLVVGSGGREHALVWKISQSEGVDKVYCAPGNGGISLQAECIPVGPDDINGIKDFALKEGIDLTVVGPELPLTLGIVDAFEEAGLKIFGPGRKAAEIEGSKVFAKELMRRYSIPTADYRVFDGPEKARAFLERASYPTVVKADGLAGGKGAIICRTREEAFRAIEDIMEKRVFGEAGSKVVVEEFLEGEEASFIVATDGERIVAFPSSQDHKALYDGDKGPNTGGMGAYSPAPVVTRDLEEEIMERIIKPTVKAMDREGRPYRGFLYAGLMITGDGPKVLEFNCRLGDPEAQPLLMRMKSDILPLLEAGLSGEMGRINPSWDERASVCVVMASRGYPGSYEKGKEIKGLEEAQRLKDVVIFHSGTERRDSRFYTAGGRVLGVTSLGRTIKEAIEKAYGAVSHIRWEGVYYRKDIGAKALAERRS